MTDEVDASGAPSSGTASHPVSLRRGLLLLTLLGVALAFRAPLAVRLLPDGLFDDCYITLRYAANLSNDLGFVYNIGERVWGTTTPLFALLLAGAARLFGVEALPLAAICVGIATGLGAIAATAWALRRASVEPTVYLLYLGALACLPAFVGSSVSGMETSLVLCLMALSLGLHARGSLPAVGLVGGLLVVARIDTVIWVAALFGHAIFERRTQLPRSGARLLGPALLAAAPWFAFAWWYFGTVVPQSAIGKVVSHGAFRRVDSAYVLSFLSTYVPTRGSSAAAWGIVLAALVVTGFGMLRVWRMQRCLRPLVTFFLAYNAVFLVSRAPLFSWYFPPAEWPFYLFAIAGAVGLARAATETTRLRALVQITAGGLALVVVARSTTWLAQNARRPVEAPWARVASFLSRHTRPEALIYVEHIGLVGFKTGRKIYDPMGLVTPEAVALRRRLGPRWLPAAIARARADVVVLYREELPGAPPWLPDETADFLSRHRAVADFENLDGYAVRVYFRVGSPRLSHVDTVTDTSTTTVAAGPPGS